MLAFCLYFFNRKIVILLVVPNQKKGAPEDRGVYKDIELLIVFHKCCHFCSDIDCHFNRLLCLE